MHLMYMSLFELVDFQNKEPDPVTCHTKVRVPFSAEYRGVKPWVTRNGTNVE